MSYIKSKDDNGFMAAEWLAATGFLLIPVFILTVSLLQVPPRRAVGTNAASQAALAAVGALNQDTSLLLARESAKEVVAQQFSGYELPDSNVSVDYVSYCPGEEVTVEVTIPIPISINPFGGSALFEFGELKSTATERIDDYAELELVGDMANGTCD